MQKIKEKVLHIHTAPKLSYYIPVYYILPNCSQVFPSEMIPINVLYDPHVKYFPKIYKYKHVSVDEGLLRISSPSIENMLGIEDRSHFSTETQEYSWRCVPMYFGTSVPRFQSLYEGLGYRCSHHSLIEYI